MPHVSSIVAISRMRKKSSGISKGFRRPGTGGPPNLYQLMIRLLPYELTMAKSQDLVHDIEYYRVLQHPIVVELTEIFDFGDTSLIVPELVLFQSKCHSVKNVVDSCECKARVISVYSTEQDRENMDATVLDLGRPREYFRENSHNL